MAQENNPTPPTPAKTEPAFSKDKLKGVDTTIRREYSEDELQKLFTKKKSENETVQLYIPFFYERMERALGKVKAQLTSQGNVVSKVEVDFDTMIAILEELVVKNWIQKFKDSQKQCPPVDPGVPNDKKQTCWVSLDKFSDADVQVSFDEKTLEIRAHIVPEMRAPRTASLTQASAFSFGEVTDEPSWFSSYININTSETFHSGKNSSPYPGGRDPITGRYDSGTRIGSLVIEANARSLENRPEVGTDQPSFVREDVRGILDFEGLGLRMQAGDLVYPIKSFQGYIPMGGVTIFSQYSLQSSRLTLPGTSYEIFLVTPAKVQVFINDQLVQILDLPAGKHSLRDFPFNNGLNNLRLEITDDTGRTETKNFTYFSSNELLKPGVSEISYSYGSPWSEKDGVRIYDSKKATYSIFHRFGFSPYVTLGVNYQANPTESLSGLEILMSSSLGYFSFEPAFSNSPGHSGGYAGKFRYVLQDVMGRDQTNRFYAFELVGMSSDFTQLQETQAFNPVAFSFTGTHSRGISRETTMNVSLGYRVNRTKLHSTDDSYLINLGFGRRWNEGISANFSMGHEKSVSGKEDISAKVFLIWSFPKERQFITATHDTSSGSSRLDWNYQPSTGTGGLTTKATINKTPISNGYNGSIDYTANRARISAIGLVDIKKGDPNQTPPLESISNKAFGVQLGTALVFAGGHLDFSRPVSDSFAILAPLKNLEGQNVRINPQSDGTYVAQTDFMGGAVDPELPSYSYSGIFLDQKNLKIGTALPTDHFLLKPKLHSGYAIPIGTDATVYFKANLIDESGKPLEMVAGVATYLDDRSKENVTVFTNRKGQVRSEGFRHGRYKLEINESDFEPVEFTIPAKGGDDVDLGNIKLKMKTK